MICRTCSAVLTPTDLAKKARRCRVCRRKAPGRLMPDKPRTESRVGLRPAPPSKVTKKAAGTPDLGSWWLNLDRRSLEAEAYRRFPAATPPQRMSIPLAGNGMVDA